MEQASTPSVDSLLQELQDLVREDLKVRQTVVCSSLTNGWKDHINVRLSVSLNLPAHTSRSRCLVHAAGEGRCTCAAAAAAVMLCIILNSQWCPVYCAPAAASFSTSSHCVPFTQPTAPAGVAAVDCVLQMAGPTLPPPLKLR
jgi:hypothetical protein